MGISANRFLAPLALLLVWGLIWPVLIQAQSTDKQTLVEITTKDGEVLELELWDVVPSFRGTSQLSLTKQPSENLDTIVWFEVPIRPYQAATSKISAIDITGKPSIYRYPRHVEEIFFFPVTITISSGDSEEWFWQGRSVSGFATTKAGGSARVSIAIADISVIRILGST